MKVPKINKSLLPFKIHYFFKNGGGSFLSFLAPMANQRGISSKGIGIIWTIHPFISAVCNIIFGYVADAFKIHRWVLTVSCALLASTFTAFFFLPAIPVSPAPIIHSSIYFQQDTDKLSLTMCLDAAANHDKLFPLCNNTQSHFESIEEIWELRCWSADHERVNISYTQKDVFSNDTTVKYQNSTKQCVRLSQESIAGLSQNDYVLTRDREISLQCESVCENSDNIQKIPITQLLSTGEFWINALCVIIIYVCIDCSSPLADTMCFVVLGEDRHKYGKTKLFGALGWGIMGPIMGGLVNIFSKNQAEINYNPAMIITALFLFFNLLYTATISTVVPGKISATGEKGLTLSLSLVSLLGSSFITGSAMGLIWTFEFIYMKSISLEWDPNFSDSNLLQGLCVGMDCFVGEVPFMFFSAYIIKKLSSVNTFSLTLTAMSMRLLICSVIKNPWIFLLAHLFHGLSFGVFVANMNSYANLIAPKGSQATMQSIVMAFFTLGKSTGALGSGILLERLGGSKTFLIMGLIVSSYTVTHVVVHYFSRRCNRSYVQDDIRGDYRRPSDQEKDDVIGCIDSEKNVNDVGAA